MYAMSTVSIGAALLLGYILYLAIYRLYLSPIAKIPGPKLAALTPWYNGYYDIWLGGQYLFAIEEMHRKYGPVVRTRPDAVHIDDPNFIDKLYTQSPKHRRDRAYTIVSAVLLSDSLLSTASHELHRRRRAALNPYFSQQNVRRLEPIVNDTLARLLRRMDGWAKSGAPVQMNAPYRAVSKDVIQEYAIGGGTRYIDMEDCNRPFFEAVAGDKMNYLGTYAYTLVNLMKKIPPSLMKGSRLGPFQGYVKDLRSMIERMKLSKELPEGRTIFHEIFNSDMPVSEKTAERLTNEATLLIFAGSETTASTLAALTYHLLSDREMLSRLRAELQSVMPDRSELPKASNLDQLPFLNALIQEALRLYPGGTHRQDRVAPDEDLVYESMDQKYRYVLPAGTTIGMAAPLVNRNSIFYERADEFWPDRYLENPNLKKYQLAFSKGTRQCIGINLAYQELQTVVAGIFRRYDAYDPSKSDQGGPTLELYQTTERDIMMHADFITPVTYPGSEGVRVRIRS